MMNDREQLLELVNSCQEEIRTLKEENQRLKEQCVAYEQERERVLNKLEWIKENQRLNNVLNELEEWLVKEQYFYGINQQGFSWGVAGDCLNKLNELKESDK